MFGFVVGTLSLIGLVGLIGSHRHRHHAYAHGCGRGHHARWGHGRGHGPGYGGRDRAGWHEGVGRAAGEVFKRRLRIDEDQEPIVDLALRDARAALTELGTTLRDSRTELADALRGDAVDDASLAAAFSRQDQAVAEARRQVVSAAKQIHDLCAERGIPVWCGGMEETGLGRAANVAIASLPGFTLPGDTSASSRFYLQDVTEPFVMDDGRLQVPTDPGLGRTPIPDVLAALTAERTALS